VALQMTNFTSKGHIFVNDHQHPIVITLLENNLLRDPLEIEVQNNI
jgi:hypothetical protein